MQFNQDGTQFALVHQKQQIIKVLTIDEGRIINFIEKVRNFPKNDGDVEFIGSKDPKDGRDISFIKKIKFDVNKRYLIGFGDNKVFLLNL